MNQTTSLTKRQHLIDEGYLVDLTRYNNQTPMACTFSVFGILTKFDPKHGFKIDLDAILHYVLLMSDVCFQTINSTTCEFTVILNEKAHTLRLVQTGDGPVITRDFLELT